MIKLTWKVSNALLTQMSFVQVDETLFLLKPKIYEMYRLSIGLLKQNVTTVMFNLHHQNMSFGLYFRFNALRHLYRSTSSKSVGLHFISQLMFRNTTDLALMETPCVDTLHEVPMK